MNLYFWGAILFVCLFVLLWLGEYATRVLETERLLFILAAWTDPVHLFAWRAGFAARDFLMRMWRLLLDLLDWMWNRLYDLLPRIWNRLYGVLEWIWTRLRDLAGWTRKTLRRLYELAEKILRNMKLVELVNSFVDTWIFLLSVLFFPLQAMRGLIGLPFRDIPVIINVIFKNHGRTIVFHWMSGYLLFVASLSCLFVIIFLVTHTNEIAAGAYTIPSFRVSSIHGEIKQIVVLN